MTESKASEIYPEATSSELWIGVDSTYGDTVDWGTRATGKTVETTGGGVVVTFSHLAFRRAILMASWIACDVPVAQVTVSIDAFCERTNVASIASPSARV